jgi:hypothetical protein
VPDEQDSDLISTGMGMQHDATLCWWLAYPVPDKGGITDVWRGCNTIGPSGENVTCIFIDIFCGHLDVKYAAADAWPEMSYPKANGQLRGKDVTQLWGEKIVADVHKNFSDAHDILQANTYGVGCSLGKTLNRHDAELPHPCRLFMTQTMEEFEEIFEAYGKVFAPLFDMECAAVEALVRKSVKEARVNQRERRARRRKRRSRSK